MSLYTIANYQYLKRRHNLNIRLAIYKIPMDDSMEDYVNVYLQDYPDLKMYIIEMIYGCLKLNGYLKIDFLDISNNFTSKNIEGYCNAI
jgi:hypothetical protein